MFVAGIFGPAVLGTVLSIVLGGWLRSCAVVLWGWGITAVMHGLFVLTMRIIVELQIARVVSDTSLMGATLYFSCLSVGIVGIVGVAIWCWLNDRRARARAGD